MGRVKGVRQVQIPDIRNCVTPVKAQKIGNLRAEWVVFKKQCADVSLALIVHDQIASTG